MEERVAGDWDVGTVKPIGSSRDDGELTADAKALTEIQAANMIILERMSAYTRELTTLQTKLESLHERVAEAEKQYAVRAALGSITSAQTVRQLPRFCSSSVRRS